MKKEKKKYELSVEAKKRKNQYISSYEKKNYKYFTIRCRVNDPLDAEILNVLTHCDNKSEFLKKVLKEYLSNHPTNR